MYDGSHLREVQLPPDQPELQEHVYGAVHEPCTHELQYAERVEVGTVESKKNHDYLIKVYNFILFPSF